MRRLRRCGRTRGGRGGGGARGDDGDLTSHIRCLLRCTFLSHVNDRNDQRKLGVEEREKRPTFVGRKGTIEEANKSREDGANKSREDGLAREATGNERTNQKAGNGKRTTLTRTTGVKKTKGAGGGRWRNREKKTTEIEGNYSKGKLIEK